MISIFKKLASKLSGHNKVSIDCNTYNEINNSIPSINNSNNLKPISKGIVNVTKIIIYNYEVVCTYLNEFIAIDLETTGLNCFTDEIIEISALKFKNGIIDKKFDSLIKPQKPISNYISSINGITNEMVKYAPNIEKVMNDFYCFIINEVNMNIPLVAHNADFDAKFLIYYLQKYGFSIDLEFCDTLHLSRKLHPEFENHKLATVISNYNITNDNAHRATFDAEACGKVFISQMNEIKSKYSSQITNLDSFAFEIANHIKKILYDKGLDINTLSYTYTSYLTVHCLYPVIKIKTKGKQKYVIITNEEYKILNSNSEFLPCSKTEGENNVRYIISSIENLFNLNHIIIQRYEKQYDSMKNYIENCKKGVYSVADFIDKSITI